MNLPPEAIKALVEVRLASMDEEAKKMFAEHVKLVREQIRKDKSAAAVAGFAAGHMLSLYEKLTTVPSVSNFALAMTAAVFAFALDEEFSQ